MSNEIAYYQTETPKEQYLDGKAFQLLYASSAISKVTLHADKAGVYIQYQLKNGQHGTLMTRNQSLKQWATIDSAVRWLKQAGVGKAEIQFADWPTGQRKLAI